MSKATAPGRYHDGHGLILRVARAGTKQWVQRLHIRGKRREFGLGGYPLVTLAMAREVALANRRTVHAGGDPFGEKRRERGVPIFAEATRKVFLLRRDGWRNAKHAGQWINHMAARTATVPPANRIPVPWLVVGLRGAFGIRRNARVQLECQGLALRRL